MLRTIYNSIASKLILTNKDNIKGVGGGNIIDEFDIVGKINPRSSESRTGFLTPRVRLAFTKLRHVFYIAPILHYFNPKCHI